MTKNPADVPTKQPATLPRFFSRIADAIGPVALLDPDDIEVVVRAVQVTVVISSEARVSAALRHQAELTCNLLARLYPRLVLVGPADVTSALRASVLSIHPGADVQLADQLASSPDVALVLQPGTNNLSTSGDPAVICVSTAGWTVAVDRPMHGGQQPFPLAALVGACLGVAEVFRYVFRTYLPSGGREQSAPSQMNVITGACGDSEPSVAPPDLLDVPTGIDLTGTYLAGAGAVGQAFLFALRTASPTGILTVVDDQAISLSNLQRYVLTGDNTVDHAKAELAAEYFTGTDLTVAPVPTRWGADERSGPQRPVVLVALDTAADRIHVAAGMHGRVYNAWTQPEDLGWSRHERFGTDPCLACLYWPDRPRPSEYELMAQAFGQHPLRMLLYLTNRVPIGAPLPYPQNGSIQLPQVPGLQPPPDVLRWFQVPLAADLLTTGMLPRDEVDSWAGRPLGEVYRDGVCAGGLITVGPPQAAREALVPLAHQSALAGVMLAVQLLVAACPSLRTHRPDQIEGRIDLLHALPQTLIRPRQRTAGCICADGDFAESWQPYAGSNHCRDGQLHP